MPRIIAFPSPFNAARIDRTCALLTRADTLRTRASMLLSVGYAHAARVLEDRADLLEFEARIQ